MLKTKLSELICKCREKPNTWPEKKINFYEYDAITRVGKEEDARTRKVMEDFDKQRKERNGSN
jgi:hypothetical protein